MTLQERAKLGGQATNARWIEPRKKLIELLEQGVLIHHAARRAGVATRTARRYRQQWRRG